MRALLGAALVLHGLGHAVLPLRGAGVLDGDAWTEALTVACYTTALIGFVAAGGAILWIGALRRHVWWLSMAAAVASLVALRMLGDLDLWPGMLLDMVLPIAATLMEAHRPSAQALRHGGIRRIVRAAWHAAGMLFVLYVAVAALLWPWHRHWGTTPEERLLALPGDPPMRQAAMEVMHAVSIAAPPAAVWPWLMQLGQDRGGFYSYDRLERLFGADIHNVDELRPEWQHRAAGDFVRAAQPGYLGGVLGDELGWYVTEVQPNRALVLDSWGAFVLQDDGGGGTRLFVRSRFSARHIPVSAAVLTFTLLELPHFIMERRMLLGIKARAEAGPISPSATHPLR